MAITFWPVLIIGVTSAGEVAYEASAAIGRWGGPARGQTPQCNLAKRPRPRSLPDGIYCTCTAPSASAIKCDRPPQRPGMCACRLAWRSACRVEPLLWSAHSAVPASCRLGGRSHASATPAMAIGIRARGTSFITEVQSGHHRRQGAVQTHKQRSKWDGIHQGVIMRNRYSQVSMGFEHIHGTVESLRLSHQVCRSRHGCGFRAPQGWKPAVVWGIT